MTLQSGSSALGRLSAMWLNPGFSFREKAIRALKSRSGFSEKMAGEVVDAIFTELSASNLQKLLKWELGFSGVVLPKKIVHIFSGNVPNPAIFSLVFGLLIGAENIGKVSSRDAGFVDIYLSSLKKFAPMLAKKTRLISPSDRAALDRAFIEADAVVAYGSDETLETIQRKLPPFTRFIGHGHKISFSLYTKKALKEPGLISKTARDLWLVNQQGCLSPVIIFIEKGAEAEKFSEGLFLKLESMESGCRTSLEASSYFKLMHLKNRHSKLWQKNWTVFFDRDLKTFPKHLGYGAICIKEYSKLSEVFSFLLPFKQHLQGLALEPASKKLSREFKKLGFSYICRAGQLQTPPLTWIVNN